MKQILLIFALLAVANANAQEPKKILLHSGFLHVGNGETRESALIGIEDGVITVVGNAMTYRYNPAEWDTIINLNGAHIYPGFVAPNTTLGITEIDAVKATRDYRELGYFNPHVRSQIAFNVESKVISTVRTNGVLISQATPRGGRVSGSSAVMKLNGWNWEDATIKADDGIHVNWPASLTGGGWWAEPAPKKANDKYPEQLEQVRAFFDKAKAYAQEDDHEVTDGRWEAMKACFTGDKRVYFHADEIQQLQDIIDFVAAYDIQFPVIVGGYDSHLITRKLADSEIPVMLVRPHSLPENEEDDVDLPFKLAALLNEGGVKFCIQNEGDMEAMNARNIPFLAGTAMAYGLSEEEAISAVSLSSCEILGIDNQYGSVEEGKSGTLFVSTGDALDMRTNNVTVALVDGVFVPLTNSQTELYEKYKTKYNSQESAPE
ncbi:MAG: amidohydrolase [Crocinitomicaceae bacterium]